MHWIDNWLQRHDKPIMILTAVLGVIGLIMLVS